MYEYLDRRYALALYQVAEENGKVEEYLEDLREICKLIDNNKDFAEVIKHPHITTRKKKQTFINIFKGNIDEELLSFLLIHNLETLFSDLLFFFHLLFLFPLFQELLP